MAARTRRSAVLELAVLGLLHEAPLHGYELRKRLAGVLGAFRAVSYGSLYPCLRTLTDRGWIVGTEDPDAGRRRARITYELTAQGKEEFQSLLSQAGPSAYEDGTFDVHFAFFSRASHEVRLKILEGRRSRLQERLDVAQELARERRRRVDAWTDELHRHGLEQAEREVRWLTGLIEAERTLPAALPERTTVAATATTPTASSTEPPRPWRDPRKHY
ncbi:PadR family transcriptional regulator [Dermacoccaceae bacterium W4C1]